MKAKELFKDIPMLERQIAAKKERVIALKHMAENCSPNLSGMPHNPSKSVSPMADCLCKAIDLEQEIRSDIIRLEEKKVNLINLISTLSNTDFQIILLKRYFEHCSWNEISMTTHLSESRLFNLHRQAMAALDEVIAESQ